MKKQIAVPLMFLALLAPTACDRSTLAPGENQEQEDCDAEDWANRETECGLHRSSMKTPTPSKVASTVKPSGVRLPLRQATTKHE